MTFRAAQETAEARTVRHFPQTLTQAPADTSVALLAIAIVGWEGWQRHRYLSLPNIPYLLRPLRLRTRD